MPSGNFLKNYLYSLNVKAVLNLNDRPVATFRQLVCSFVHCSKSGGDTQGNPSSWTTKNIVLSRSQFYQNFPFSNNSSFKMCRRVTERFFHNCGHVERTEISSINPECFEVTHIILYDDGKFCSPCIWGRFEPEYRFSTAFSDPCDGREGRVQTVILQNADNWNAITEDNIWARRKDLIKRLNSWQGERLGEKFQERYNELREDDISRGVLIQHQLYYLGPGPFDKNFLRKLQPQEVPEDKENCFCGFSVKVHGEEGCEGGGPCLLPCGHIFGYNCILRWMEGEKSDRCPQCFSLLRIFRVAAQVGYPKGFMEHFTYDHDSKLLFISPMPPWTNPNMNQFSSSFIARLRLHGLREF
ncbi:uncharacterized protein K444DRAFT_667870 [Hyaloscypha bicolor E]|uniref:RING-type domain-containing protein n=1 Tax=Hyaloscypha bicolor E TaxID=1095630 RepID=A0A2J6SU40_9HELO|nr:uncharacterized protein K444DRAFT_667870 [Hyaloscypha bicolor E]PMD54282.1 hypothetical protein K444DRAFT_667870 [Hyaloscypha bicolor E]